jgi:hypothetical protein
MTTTRHSARVFVLSVTGDLGDAEDPQLLPNKLTRNH